MQPSGSESRQLRTSGDANPILSYPIQSNSFATPLLEGNYDIRTVRKFLGHLDVKTTMITNVLKCCSWGVRSPIDEP